MVQFRRISKQCGSVPTKYDARSSHIHSILPSSTTKFRSWGKKHDGVGRENVERSLSISSPRSKFSKARSCIQYAQNLWWSPTGSIFPQYRPFQMRARRLLQASLQTARSTRVFSGIKPQWRWSTSCQRLYCWVTGEGDCYLLSDTSQTHVLISYHMYRDVYFV